MNNKKLLISTGIPSYLSLLIFPPNYLKKAFAICKCPFIPILFLYSVFHWFNHFPLSNTVNNCLHFASKNDNIYITHRIKLYNTDIKIKFESKTFKHLFLFFY